jgi:hypothetical protein
VTPRDLGYKKRRGLMFALRCNGAKLNEIGALFGLSRERVRTILVIEEGRMRRAADVRFRAAPNWPGRARLRWRIVDYHGWCYA